MVCEVWVDGLPVGQPRVKSKVFKGKDGKPKSGVYTPKQADIWKACVRQVVCEQYHGPVHDHPIEISMVFYLPRPKRLMRAKDPYDRIPHSRKPDGDNLEKAVLDALDGGPVWRDDSQVFSVRREKYYTPKDGQVGAKLNIAVLFPAS